MKQFLIAIIGVACVSSVGLSAQDAKVAAGKKAYDDLKCSTCHQIKNVGNKMFPLDGIATKMKDVDIKRWFTHTVEMEAKLPKKPAVTMSGYMKTKKLSTENIDALVAYMMTLK